MSSARNTKTQNDSNDDWVLVTNSTQNTETQTSNDDIGDLILSKSIEELDEIAKERAKQLHMEEEKLTSTANELIRTLLKNENCELTFCLLARPTIIFNSEQPLKTLQEYENILTSIGLPVKKPTPKSSFFWAASAHQLGVLTISARLELLPLPKHTDKNIKSDDPLEDIKYIVNKLSAHFSQLEQSIEKRSQFLSLMNK